jgi:hypothetical protein
MSQRPKCVHCGAKYGRRDDEELRVEWPAGQSMPPYRGNKKLARSIVATNVPHSKTGNLFGWHHVWDGETWVKPYEPFCTLRCALDYARRAYARSKQPALRRA